MKVLVLIKDGQLGYPIIKTDVKSIVIDEEGVVVVTTENGDEMSVAKSLVEDIHIISMF